MTPVYTMTAVLSGPSMNVNDLPVKEQRVSTTSHASLRFGVKDSRECILKKL